MKDKRAFFIYILLTLVLWQLADSLSKIFVKIRPDSPFFIVSEVNNTGAAFGILNNCSLFLGILGVIACFLVSFYVFKNVSFANKNKILFCSFFTSGILGNTIERLTDGRVFDFIKLTFIEFPVFNFYDVLICLSVFIYILYFIRGNR